MATYGLLHPKFVFGMSKQCQSVNAYFLDATTIIYPAGNTIVMYNMDQKSQSFLHGVEKGDGITAFTVSSTKVYAAVAQTGDKPSIVIFDLKLNKKRKTLQFNDTIAKEYISLSFTQDSIHLASLTGSPEYNVVFWKWDKTRMLCQAKTTGGVGPVYEISCNPVETNVMCAIGKSSFRFFRYNEGHMKPFGFQKGDAHHFLCHAWLGKGDRLLAGTFDGHLMLFERGDYRYDIPIGTLINSVINAGKMVPTGEYSVEKRNDSFPGMNFADVINFDKDKKHEPVQPAVTSPNVSSTSMTAYIGRQITALAAYSKGFAVAFGTGNVVIYEEQLVYSTPEEHYTQLYFIRIPIETSDPEDRVVKALAINTTEEVILATTKSGQVYYFALASAEIKDESEMLFEHASSSFHNGAIIAMDVSIRKSLFVTAGKDHFIRIWNYATLTQDISKEIAEDILCISFHPTGLFLLAGCLDKIVLFTILMDDIRELRDFHVRGCRECVFSNGGHVFAAANGNVIQIYSTTTFDNTHNLKGHNNKIRGLKWSLDDTRLFSVGADGAIYEWDPTTGHRTADFVERNSNLVDVAVTPDSKTYFAISGNGSVKEIQIQDGVLLKELSLDLEPQKIVISRSGKVLVAGMNGGIVRSFRQPLTYSNEWFDFHMHVEAINAICITVDEMYCISCSTDGTIVVWRLTDPEGRAATQERDFNYATEILVTKSDLDERDLAMSELRQKFGELRLEMEYQMKRKDMSYQEELKFTNQAFTSEIEGLNMKIDELLTIKDEADQSHYQNISGLSKENYTNIEHVESHYNAKLIAEFEKYNALQNLLQQTIQDYETKLQELDLERTRHQAEIIEYFEGKIKDKNSALDQAYINARVQISESEEMQKQIEEDADEEILQIRYSYEKKLNSEANANRKLQAESGLLKKKLSTMHKEIDDHKGEVQRLLHEGLKMKTVISVTEKEVSTLRKDLVDRDVNVHDKEKIIYDLKKTNNELEKFKFVLDYKIKELKKMIEPKEREIVYLKQQNADMENELEATIIVRNGLELQVNELTNKLKITESEFRLEKRLRSRFAVLVKRIRAHMSRCHAVMGDYKSLKKSVKSMYDKYGNTLQIDRASNAEQEAICELVRQKNHLEMCLTSIEKQMMKDVDFTRNEQHKCMHENMLLVYEINNLRKELKICRDRILSYENALGINNSPQAAEQTEMRLKLQNAVVEREEVQLEFNKELEAKENLIEAQQVEIDTLANKIIKVQDLVSDLRPESSSTAPAAYLRRTITEN